MLQTRGYLALLAMILLGPSSSEGSVHDNPQILVGQEEPEYSPVNNGSLNRNLVTQDIFPTEKFNAFERFGNKKNQDFLRNFKIPLFEKPIVTSRGKTAQFDPIQKADLRGKKSPVEKAEFSPSYAVFFLELIMILSSNVFAHMVRTYKHSVPHIQVNIIIVISHYIVELANGVLTIQVGLPLTDFPLIYLTSYKLTGPFSTEPCQTLPDNILRRYPFLPCFFTNVHTAKKRFCSNRYINTIPMENYS